MRICWYLPAGSAVVEPSTESKQPVPGMFNRSICLGALVRSTSVTQPAPLPSAVLDMCARTCVTVTQMWENCPAPSSASQMGGSLILVVTVLVTPAPVDG